MKLHHNCKLEHNFIHYLYGNPKCAGRLLEVLLLLV